MTATGQCAPSATDTATEPNSAVLNPLRPREPIVTTSAVRLASINAGVAGPSTSSPRTLVPVRSRHSFTARLTTHSASAQDTSRSRAWIYQHIGSVKVCLVAGPIDRRRSSARTIDTHHDSTHRSIGRAANDDDRARAPSHRTPGKRPQQHGFGRLLVRCRQHEQIGVSCLLDQHTAARDSQRRPSGCNLPNRPIKGERGIRGTVEANKNSARP